MRCRFTFVYIHTYIYIYIYIYICLSQSTLDTSIVQLLRRNPQQICAHKHLSALGGMRIFAGIVNSVVGGYIHGSCQSAIFAYVILPAWPGPFSLLSCIQVHPTGFALGRVQISGWKLRSRHMLWSRQKTYIQPIVLQEGVHTILHFA